MRPTLSCRFTSHAAPLRIRTRRRTPLTTGGSMSKTVRRVVTGHDKDGTAIVAMDGTINPVTRAAGVASALLWVTDETPADISGGKDRADRTIGVPPPMNGSILRIVDFPPVAGEIKVDNAAFTSEMGLGTQQRRKGKYTDHPFMHRRSEERRVGKDGTQRPDPTQCKTKTKARAG